MDRAKIKPELDAAFEVMELRHAGDDYPDKGPVEIAAIMTAKFIGICLERGILAPGPGLDAEPGKPPWRP